uniref:Uncharacterized protein n=1 Tax=Chenopodium quinoa TaxID=63459 RepID=A0A803KZE1_CHEQI
MASFLSHGSATLHLSTDYRYLNSTKLHHSPPKIYRIKCYGLNKENSVTRSNNASVTTKKEDGSESESVVLKVAWYASELLGIGASLFRSPPSDVIDEYSELPCNESGAIDRAAVVETIKEDFQRSYFVTGSFKGLRRFKRNCTNFGSLIKKSDMKLMKWEDFEDKGIGHWRFGCIMSFPWKPILSATGYTEYYYDPKSGKVCRHVEHWNVPKMALLKQLLKPSRQITR